jgi:hypothetical protein
MARIFISSRRDDSAGDVLALVERLRVQTYRSKA